jgi:predicted amidohydrolase YtcJ
MVRASMDGFQVAVHAIGDAANADALAAFGEVAQVYPGDRRWRIEHAQVIDPADFGKFAASGVIASMQPVHQTSDRTMAEARLGPARLTGAYAWKSLQKAGAGLATAISRTDAASQPFGGWRPDDRVSRETALDGFTRTAAFAAFAEDRLGTLMPGMRADFLLVDGDPMLSTPDQIRTMKPLEVWIGGRRQFVRGDRP